MKTINKKGLSLIEVVVAMGVLSIMSYAIIDMVQNQNKAIKTTQYSLDAVEAQNQLQKYLLDSAVCMNSINVPVAPGATISIQSIKRNSSQPLLSVGDKIGGVEIQTLSVYRLPAPNSSLMELTASLKKTNADNSYGGEQIKPIKINLSAEFQPSAPNTIKRCFSQFESVVDTAVSVALEKVCTELCPNCTFDPIAVKCVKPPPSQSKAIYRNINTNQLTLGQVAPRVFTHCCRGQCAGQSVSEASKKCTDSGGVVTSTDYSRGGCGGGGKKSYTGTAHCSYSSVSVLEGYLNPIPQ